MTSVTPEKQAFTKDFRMSTYKVSDDKFNNDENNHSKRLHFAIWPLSNFETFKELIKRRPEEIHGRFGPHCETLLHRSCRYGNKKVFDYLCIQGAPMNVRNKQGMTPLHLACKFSRIEMIKELIERNVALDETDDNGDQAIHFAAQSGCFYAINKLTEKGITKCVKGSHGNNIVHCAAKYGQYELLHQLLEAKCFVDSQNELTETPLHLAAAWFSYKHNDSVDLIKLLLQFGADLNATTIWGDTAAHYAASKGTPKVLKFLIDNGCHVDKKNDNQDFTSFFNEHNISIEDQKDFQMTFLQKIAKSGCIIKGEFALECVMSARNKLCKNMHFESRGLTFEEDEMNEQEMMFSTLSMELNDVDSDKKSGSHGTLHMFLKYSPDSLLKLFDLCIIKPCFEQVQGIVYFDFFLFHPHTKDAAASEMKIITSLMTSGKEKFLIHPIFEVFLKLKWYKTWSLYLFYIFMVFMFLLSLAGYSLVHFGKLYSGFENYDYKIANFWWYFLASTHSYMTAIEFVQLIQVAKYVSFMTSTPSEDAIQKKSTIIENLFKVVLMILKNLLSPILIGLVLYGNFDQEYIRYFLAIAVILTSYHFMEVISRLPRVGLYVHMLSKVMVTVLNFFVSYSWHFIGYAIAFHILLNGSGSFTTIFDSLVKILAMVMGEYEYTINFGSDSSLIMAKILFVVFVIDMSVVLMNLVLGLAISDIDELQKNSEVSRIMRESCTVVYMENLYMAINKIPWISKWLSARITNDRTCLFQDTIYLELMDLDKSPLNSLVVENSFPNSSKTVYTSPHTIVTNVADIIKRKISGLRDLVKNLEGELIKTQVNQKDMLVKLTELHEYIFKKKEK